MKQTAPNLLELRGVGVEVTGALLAAAGDNPARLSDEAAFVAMCGVSPVDAPSGSSSAIASIVAATGTPAERSGSSR